MDCSLAAAGQNKPALTTACYQGAYSALPWHDLCIKPIQRYEQGKRKYFANASFPHLNVLDVALSGFMSRRKQRIQARKIPQQLLGSTPAGAAKLHRGGLGIAGDIPRVQQPGIKN